MAVALLALGVLAGCTSSPAAPTKTVVPPASTASAAVANSASQTSASPTPAAAPLTCDDLVPKAQIITALSGGRSQPDWVVLRTSTADGRITGELNGEKAVQGAGGLSCSWSAGPPSSETTAAVLTVAVLPGAVDDWSAQMYGDSPTPERRTFAGMSAAAACGDPGCGASATVGSSWVRVDLATGSREGGDTVFAKETDDEVFDGLRPAVESVFRVVQQASDAQLRFPDHLTGDATPADCRAYLTKADIADALDVTRIAVNTDRQPSGVRESLTGAAEHRIGDSVCSVEDPKYSYPPELASVTVAPGQSWAIDDLAAKPAERGDLRVVQLKGQVSGEQAVSSCGSSGSSCTVVFSLGSTAIEIESERAEPVAEAIFAAAR